MTSFTPGPWKTATRVNNFIDIFHSFGNVKGAITHALCRVQARDSWVKEAEANARLIAAAPELLEALQTILAANNIGSAHIIARAAIAKATS